MGFVVDAGGCVTRATRVSKSVDFEGNRLRRLRRGQHASAIHLAIEPEPIGETDRHIFPGNGTAGVFFQRCSVIAWLDFGASFEPFFERLFGSFDFDLETPQATAKRQHDRKLGL
jgi:hypothetical protein